MDKLRKDILMFQQHQDESLYEMAIDYAAGRRLRKLRPEEAWETIEDLAQYEEKKWNEPIFSEKGSPDYIDGNLEHELERFTFPKRPYQEEFEGRILKIIDDQEDQIRQLEEDMRKTKDTFMCLADSLIATLKVKIEAQRAYSIKTKKVATFPTHTPTVTPEILKPIIDEDEVEIKMMGTRMDKESLDHNLYENDITLIICHNFSPTSNPPIQPKDSGSFRMKVVEPLTIHTPPSPQVAYLHRNGMYRYYHLHLTVIFDEKKLGSSLVVSLDDSWMTI
ncbi:hypothetical protein Tco_0152074 [Tanacetum coccineum]